MPPESATPPDLTVDALDRALLVWGNIMFCGNCVVACGIGGLGRRFANALDMASGRPAAWYHPDHGWVQADTGRVLRPCNYRTGAAA